jgi:hypothetical protein
VLISLKLGETQIFMKESHPKAIAEKVKKMLLGREIYFER